jgi:hypothetical protein
MVNLSKVMDQMAQMMVNLIVHREYAFHHLVKSLSVNMATTESKFPNNLPQLCLLAFAIDWLPALGCLLFVCIAIAGVKFFIQPCSINSLIQRLDQCFSSSDQSFDINLEINRRNVKGMIAVQALHS